MTFCAISQPKLPDARLQHYAGSNREPTTVITDNLTLFRTDIGVFQRDRHDATDFDEALALRGVHLSQNIAKERRAPQSHQLTSILAPAFAHAQTIA